MSKCFSKQKYPVIAAAAVLSTAAAALLAITTTTPHRIPVSVSKPPLASSRALPTIAEIPRDQLQQDSSAERIYREFKHHALWQGQEGRQRITTLSAALPAIDAQGLDTQRVRSAIAAMSIATSAEINRRDVELTNAFIDILRSERVGAINFEMAASYWKIPAENYDAVPDAVQALRTINFARTISGLTPSSSDYMKLVDALAKYREIAANGGWETLPDGAEILLSDDKHLTPVKERLALEGYHVGTISELKEAIATFQIRHGLVADGRLGRSTLAELNVTPDARVQQIAVNLERWRHLPREQSANYVAVNTADATVVVFHDGAAKMSLRAVTGDRRHPTPVLISAINAVTFNPPWDIPTSIAEKEILPKLKKDPTYLATNNMSVVNGSLSDPHGQYMNWAQFTGASLPFRLRQQPGASNALGYVKFEMQNPYNIYLHDTPSRALFNKPERHLSHGCVRVEQPRQLAFDLLSSSGTAWDESTIDAAIAAGQTRRVAIRPAIPVYVLYWTAFADEDGVHFREDAYQRDGAIAERLQHPQAAAGDAVREE